MQGLYFAGEVLDLDAVTGGFNLQDVYKRQVMWRVTDTAKAVFHVDNYKEYLSLQCDSALRNIVRIYPYDVAPNVDTTGDGIADEGSLRGSSEIVAGQMCIRDRL